MEDAVLAAVADALIGAGIDVPAGLSMCGHKPHLLRRMLERFRQQQRDIAGSFRAAREDPDRRAAERLAHSLKSTAGLLGIPCVREAAATLEEACADGAAEARVTSDLAALAAALDPVIRALDAQSGWLTAVDRPPAPADGRAVETLGAELRQLLSEHDTRALDVFACWRPAAADRFGSEPLARIERCLHGYDFAAAIAWLDRLVRRDADRR